MKIKCYDKYLDQHIIIEWSDDHIYYTDTSSNYSSGNLRTTFMIDKEYYDNHPDEYAEDPGPYKWSDPFREILSCSERPNAEIP